MKLHDYLNFDVDRSNPGRKFLVCQILQGQEKQNFEEYIGDNYISSRVDFRSLLKLSQFITYN